MLDKITNLLNNIISNIYGGINMIVSFFGHSSFDRKKIDINTVLQILEDQIKGVDVEFYLGNYGFFDDFAYKAATEYKKLHSNAKLVFITPYINNVRCNDFAKRCDSSIYPEIEKVPLKFAIIERNKWVAKRSDLIIFYYVKAGGTGIVYDYAVSKNKKLINLAMIPF